MTTKQKTAIAIGSGLLVAYAAVFIYQRIQRAKADASELSSEEALKILRDKKQNSDTEIPEFSSEDSIPQVPNPDDSILNDDEGVNIPESNLTELQQWDLISGMGDY
jgi:hypothetical protein